MTRAVIVMVGLLAAAGCGAASSDPPHIQVDRTACARCGMLVSDVRYAAASQAAGEPARVFDDIGCLLADAHARAQAPERLWFHDADTGAWIPPAAAPVFVRAASLRTPMGGGIAAFAARAAAERFAAAHDASHNDVSRVVDSAAALLAAAGQVGFAKGDKR